MPRARSGDDRGRCAVPLLPVVTPPQAPRRNRAATRNGSCHHLDVDDTSARVPSRSGSRTELSTAPLDHRGWPHRLPSRTHSTSSIRTRRRKAEVALTTPWTNRAGLQPDPRRENSPPPHPLEAVEAPPSRATLIRRGTEAERAAVLDHVRRARHRLRLRVPYRPCHRSQRASPDA